MKIVQSQTHHLRQVFAETADLESRITILLQQQVAQSNFLDDPLIIAFNSGNAKLNHHASTESATNSTCGSILQT